MSHLNQRNNYFYAFENIDCIQYSVIYVLNTLVNPQPRWGVEPWITVITEDRQSCDIEGAVIYLREPIDSNAFRTCPHSIEVYVEEPPLDWRHEVNVVSHNSVQHPEHIYVSSETA